MECAQAVLEYAEKHEFQIWTAVGTCLHGAGLANQGRAEEGLTQIQRGMIMYQELKSPPIFWPLLRSLQAGVCGLAGRTEEGLAILDEILGFPAEGYGSVLSVEFYRLKGDLLALSPEKSDEAEHWYLSALKIAGESGASMLELRAAKSLARLWWDTDKHEQGRQLLSKAYAKITEGYGTPDMVEARELLGIN